MRQWLSLIAALHDNTERCLLLLDGKAEESKARLMEAHDLFCLMEEEFPVILAQLEQKKELPKRVG